MSLPLQDLAFPSLLQGEGISQFKSKAKFSLDGLGLPVHHLMFLGDTKNLASRWNHLHLIS